MPELPAARRARYVDAARPLACDAGRHRRRSAAARYFEGRWPPAGPVPTPSGRQLVTGEYLRLAKGEGGAAAVARVDPGELGRAGATVEAGRALGHQRQGGLRSGTRRAVEPVAEIVAEAGLPADQRHRRAPDARSRRVIDANPAAVADVRAGKAQAIGFLTGQVMKQTRGQANAATVGALLRELLGHRLSGRVLLNIVLWVAGVVLLPRCIWQVRQPLAQYRSLEATEANLRRYDDWRGGRLVGRPGAHGRRRDAGDLRDRVRLWRGHRGGVAAVGFIVR